MADQHANVTPSPVISRRRALLAVGLLLALVGVGIAYAFTLVSFSHETSAHKTPFVAGNPPLAFGVDVDGEARAVSPETETATIHLSFKPKGALVNANGRLVHPLLLLVETATGPVEKTFKAGQIMRPADVTVALVDGYVANYPFDRYHTGLDVLITRADTHQTVPTTLDVFAAIHGFSFSLQQEGSDKDSGHSVNMTIRRSTATQFFSLFLMVTMWALTLGVLGLLVRILVFGRELQFGTFAFLAALLFAFPAIRNAQPSVPPIGVLSDYISFFWCESLVAVSLITLLSVWLGRKRYD